MHGTTCLNTANSCLDMQATSLLKVLTTIQIFSAFVSGSCPFDYIGDGECDEVNNVLDCDHDGGIC